LTDIPHTSDNTQQDVQHTNENLKGRACIIQLVKYRFTQPHEKGHASTLSQPVTSPTFVLQNQRLVETD
jgi:hypothetical protein